MWRDPAPVDAAASVASCSGRRQHLPVAPCRPSRSHRCSPAALLKIVSSSCTGIPPLGVRWCAVVWTHCRMMGSPAAGLTHCVATLDLTSASSQGAGHTATWTQKNDTLLVRLPLADGVRGRDVDLVSH